MSEAKKGRKGLCCGLLIFLAAIGNLIIYFEDPTAEGAAGSLVFSVVVFSIVGIIVLFFIVSFIIVQTRHDTSGNYSEHIARQEYEEYRRNSQYPKDLQYQDGGLLKNMKDQKERKKKQFESVFGHSNPGSNIVIKNSNIVIDSNNVNIGTNPMYADKDDYEDSMQDWTCENCGAENVGEAVICEKCGERNKNDSNLISRVIEHEKFRKKFKKFKQQHPDLVKKFTRILKHEVEMMISPSGEVNIDDNDVPEISAEEIIRMSMSLGMSCDEVLDMMIEQSKNYE